MYSDGLLKLPIFTIQKNHKILLTVYSLSLSKLFHICFGLDILSLTDASACPNLLLYQDLSELTSSKYTKVLFCVAGHTKKGPQGFIRNPLVLLFSGLFSFHSPLFLLCVIL